jgi:hypothetical protein
MLTNDPLEVLAVAHERGRRTRRALAMSLRRAADRLDPGPFAKRPASQS